MKIFIASNNKGKIKEIKEIFKNLKLEFLSVLDKERLAELGISIPNDFDVEETGKNFSENAFLKAKAYAELTDLAVIADDSGLEVMALDDFPGVKSNRWMEGTTEEKNLALLELLKGKERKARFRTVICYFNPENGEEKYFKGEVRGEIAEEIRGPKHIGFGYDPIFIPNGYEQTFSELGYEVKNKISHRSKSLEELAKFFRERLG